MLLQRLFRALPFLILLLTMTACAAQNDAFHRIDKKSAGFTKHFEESLFAITERSLYSVELLLPENGLRAGKNEFELIVHDSGDKDVEGAKIAIAAESSGRATGREAKVSDKGSGLYAVSDLSLDSPGPARLKVSVSLKGIDDRATFDFPIVRAVEAKPR